MFVVSQLFWLLHKNFDLQLQSQCFGLNKVCSENVDAPIFSSENFKCLSIIRP